MTFDHRLALTAVRNRSDLAPDEKRVMYVLIMLADERGKADATDEQLAMGVALLAEMEADGDDPVEAITQARQLRSQAGIA